MNRVPDSFLCSPSVLSHACMARFAVSFIALECASSMNGQFFLNLVTNLFRSYAEGNLPVLSNSNVRHESDKEECEKRKREVTMGFVPHRPYQGMRS